MTEISERRVFFAFAKFPVVFALLISAFVVSISAQLNTADESSARPEGTRAKLFAFYGTNRADWATVNTAGGTGNPIVWRIRKNQAGPEVSTTHNFGLVGDTITPGSYTGDVTYDAGIHRVGANWIDPFDNGPGEPYSVIQFGSGVNPGRNGDYDGDGIEDITVLQVAGSALRWWYRPTSDPSNPRVVPFGSVVTGQSALPFKGADFTGDGRDELVFLRVVNATGFSTWHIGDSVTGAQLFQINFGNFNSDFMINPADYTGDGKADIIVWRAGAASQNQQVWYIWNSATGVVTYHWFGIGDPNFLTMDLPVRGDYDGDNIHDIAIWRPSTQTFWVRASSDGSLIIQQWGLAGDTPLGNFFVF